MVFEGGREYTGYLFARANGGASVSVTISLENYEQGTVLAAVTVDVPSIGYNRINFSLTPAASTNCVDINETFNDDDAVSCGKPIATVGHTCAKCGGEFVVAVSTPGASVYLNYVMLEPGQWGRVPGLSVLSSAAANLAAMGIKAIRQGGSYASSGEDSAAYYQWQKWTGPPWTRPSRANGVWRACLLAGWGPFEMIDMCTALGIEPIITTSESDTPEQFADLVEYAWGNASTKLGAQRTADGHPDPYRVKWIELGNEQYNANYVDQVAAMEAKATELGMPKTLYYMFPQNGFLSPDDIAKAKSLNLPADHLIADIHDGGTGAVDIARGLFAKNAGFEHGAVNAETNARIHTQQRALMEAGDLNDFFSAADVASRLHFRAASFCTGDATDFDAWDQGISFFLPNMTWLQPPGYVHQMVSRSFFPRALNVSSPSGPSVFSSQLSPDGTAAVLRYVNAAPTSRNVTFELAATGAHGGGCAAGAAPAPATATVWTLAADDLNAANPPGNPTLVSPTNATHPGFGSGTMLTVPPNSYTVVILPIGRRWCSGA